MAAAKTEAPLDLFPTNDAFLRVGLYSNKAKIAVRAMVRKYRFADEEFISIGEIHQVIARNAQVVE